MNVVVKRLLTALLSLLLIVYVGYQGYCALYNPFRTTRATSGTYQDTITADSIVLHAETPVTYSGGGVLDYTREDGEDVSKGGEVAAVYNSEEAAENSRKIKSLQSELDLYSKISSTSSANSIDIDVINSKITSSFLELCEAAGSSDTTKIDEKKTELLSLLNKKQIATGKENDFSKQIENLKNKINKLSQSASKQSNSVNAPISGYFVSKADGYENCYDVSKVGSITPKEVKSLIDSKPKNVENSVGKILSDYETFIAVTLSQDDSYKLKEGESVKVKFLYSSVPNVSATVYAINKDSEGTAVVLRFTDLSSSLCTLRKPKIEIVTSNFTGIKVTNGCIHIVNGVKGVFVRNGNLVNFRKIQPIYSAQGYTVSQIMDSDSTYLQVYDEIITNGDDLYDGKTIK